MSKPEIGEEVRVRRGIYDDSPWSYATVIEHLSVQFLAGTPEGEVVFGVYSSEGEAWKRGW